MIQVIIFILLSNIFKYNYVKFKLLHHILKAAQLSICIQYAHLDLEYYSQFLLSKCYSQFLILKCYSQFLPCSDNNTIVRHIWHIYKILQYTINVCRTENKTIEIMIVLFMILTQLYVRNYIRLGNITNYVQCD